MATTTKTTPTTLPNGDALADEILAGAVDKKMIDIAKGKRAEPRAWSQMGDVD